jgi:hypothetical protein
MVNWVTDCDPIFPMYPNFPSGSKVMKPGFVPVEGKVPVMTVKLPAESIVYCEIAAEPEFTT